MFKNYRVFILPKKKNWFTKDMTKKLVSYSMQSIKATIILNICPGNRWTTKYSEKL